MEIEYENQALRYLDKKFECSTSDGTEQIGEASSIIFGESMNIIKEKDKTFDWKM